MPTKTAARNVKPTNAAGVSNVLGRNSPTLRAAMHSERLRCTTSPGGTVAVTSDDANLLGTASQVLNAHGYLHSVGSRNLVVKGRRPVTPPRKPTVAGADAPKLRLRSAYGPCIPLGRLVRTTDKFYVASEGAPHGPKKISKSRHGLHLSPCPRCTDAPNTCYPRGYTD